MNRVINKVNKRISLSNAAILLISATLMTQLLGFFRNRLVAANFTKINPGSTDAFFAAFQIPDFFFLTIAAGALGVAFMPVLADRLAANDKKGIWDITNSLLNLLSIIMFAVALIVFIFARPLIHYVVAPHLPEAQLNQAVQIMRLVAINPLLFTLSGILTSVQQTFGRFFFFAVAPLFYNLSIIASIYIFKYHIGIVGLGIGALVGAILQLLIAMLGLWGLKFRWRPKINFRTDDFKLIMRKLPARSIDQGVDSINSIVETNRATLLGSGAVTYYNFATTLMNVPVMLFGTAIATAAFPRFTERLAQRRPDLFHKDFFKVLEIMIWIAMPVVVVGYFTRGYLARLLYGDFQPQVSLIFGYLTIAIFARIMYTIISRYFYAQKDTTTPLIVSLATIGLNIVLAFNLARPGAYGITGLALAQSIAAVSEIFLLLMIMLIRDPYIFNRDFWTAVGRIISVTGFSVLTAFVMISIFPLRLADRGLVTLGAKFGVIAGTTMLMHLAMSALFGLDEARIFFNKAYQFILKPIRMQ
ncbi:MAG TPA: murein biosynthesis integral membrane protein MurJ [Candidatus Saccharimonadales bacterium]|nr:murein biosynthesis integral membrane protein MurJ [Candidatus Saccharimonadales bacterium]